MPNLLIIDDDEIIIKLIKIILKYEGYKIDTASTGKKAIKILEKKRYDVVLLDIKLSDISGMIIIEHIKKIDPNIIVIMVTGYNSINNAIESLKKGADGYINKPINPKELLLTLKTKLKKTK